MGTGYNDCKVGNQLVKNTYTAAQSIFLMVITESEEGRGSGSLSRGGPSLGSEVVTGYNDCKVGNQLLYNTHTAA